MFRLASSAGAVLVLLVPLTAAQPLVAVSPTGDADASWIAVSGTGGSRGYYAMSGTGEANGTMPLSLLGTCRTYFTYTDTDGEVKEVNDSRKCVDIKPEGDAYGYYLAIAPTGNARGSYVVIAGTGVTSGSAGCTGYDLVLIGGTSCTPNGTLVAISILNHAGPAGLSASGTGDSQAGLVAASIFGGARQGHSSVIGAAVSVFGPAQAWSHDGNVAISVFGDASGNTAISVLGHAEGENAISVGDLLP